MGSEDDKIQFQGKPEGKPGEKLGETLWVNPEGNPKRILWEIQEKSWGKP